MTDDRAFLDAIAADPDDEATRLIYADWLEERGDPRSRFLRLESEYRKTPKLIGESKRQLRELARLAENLDLRWAVRVSRVPIENCDVDELGFAFKCPKQWNKLELTDTAGARFCAHCSRNVYYCTSIDQAKYHASEGHCVAVDLRVKRRPNDLDVDLVEMGIVDLDYVPDREERPSRIRWWQVWK